MKVKKIILKIKNKEIEIKEIIYKSKKKYKENQKQEQITYTLPVYIDKNGKKFVFVGINLLKLSKFIENVENNPKNIDIKVEKLET